MVKSPLRYKVSGFTLVELLVVISIIAILAGVVGINAKESGQKSRDVDRQGDLRALQSAIELYKNKNGKYPAQCNATGGAADGWSGQLGTNFACNDGTNQYIVGLAPEFISVLPVDPKLNGNDSGYVYRTNTNGTVYKLMAMNTVEAELVGNSHSFKRCDWDSNFNASSDIEKSGLCTNVKYDIGQSAGANNTPEWCKPSDVRFQKSYAIWGGIAPLASSKDLVGLTIPQKTTAVRDTTAIICK